MSRRRHTTRLVVALSVAAMLGVFVLYTSIAGGATLSLAPSKLAGHHEKVALVGQVVGPVRGDADGAGMRFALRDIGGTVSVPVVYHGSVPDLLAVGRHVFVSGRLEDGVFVASPGSLVTKCPSKYVPATSDG
ncbi:MAG TPA: cytochrome c maturation protein CcmE [Gaiellaceae bacterium]|nr:cytochrome c maturation protein CcmE [Gaiellaceae bacterium]